MHFVHCLLSKFACIFAVLLAKKKKNPQLTIVFRGSEVGHKEGPPFEMGSWGKSSRH